MVGATEPLLAHATVVMKLLHIATLCLWVAGLIVLALLFRSYHPDMPKAAFIRFRKLTHYGYIRFVTPAAVTAIGAGIALIILRWIFEPWLVIKLVMVSGLAIVHAFIGHMIALTAETAGGARLVSPWWVLAAVIALSAAIFWIVLEKPPVWLEFPQWMTQPQFLPEPSPPVGSSLSALGRMVPS